MTYSRNSSPPTYLLAPAPVEGADTADTADTGAAITARPGRSWLAGTVAAASAALQACGGGGGGGEGVPASGAPGGAANAASGGPASGAAAIAGTTIAGGAQGPLGQVRTYAVSADDASAARFLLQAQFSASETEIASVRSLGYAGWLATQFAAPAGTTAWDWLDQHGYADTALGTYNSSYPADFALWWQLIQSPDALRKRVALALSEIFVVSINGLSGAWPSYVAASWWDMLSGNAFGNFRTLLEDVTLHPAMGAYLNIRGSLKETSYGRQPDENYARELMQLMTIGLIKLNPDGTAVVSGGVPVETYTQNDVINLARVFTGYNYDMSGNVNLAVREGTISSNRFARLPMVLNASLHSTYDVSFLGTTIAGSTDGATARRTALDTLFNHANVGPFIGRQLIQRLVTSNPSPAYVARVSAAFADNGRGTRGDIAAVVAAVLLDEEARGPAGLGSTTFGRLREPMLRLAQFARSCGLASAKDTWKLGDQSGSNSIGQSPLRAGSVFNFFRPGYVPPATRIAAAGLVAPEFQLVNQTAISAYVNTMQVAVRYGFWSNNAAAANYDSSVASGFDIAPAYTVEKTLVTDAGALVGRLNLVFAAGQLSTSTTTLIVSALEATRITATSSDTAKLERIAAAVLMVMASLEYLVQK